MISFGRYGGFYFHKGNSTRICLGWMAITLFMFDADDRISEWIEYERNNPSEIATK
jgi:hypothetical protein